ncbi:MAG: DUF4062 domain-containing protein [Bifidobacteriaceae bacterium]|jgi:hypothetical protein|nr:DUF4062 domain-containing protein [Bifidobacteriaceae bacterium]
MGSVHDDINRTTRVSPQTPAVAVRAMRRRQGFRVDRKYQVFVSSTYRDLQKERREVIQALLELDCFPAGMEMFSAADADQWTLIKKVIDKCDYYIVIVGGRYGSTTADGISYTEKEYDYAVEKGLPVLGFVHAEPDTIPLGKSEKEPEAVAKLREFRAKVMTRMVKQYDSAAHLGAVVSRGLFNLIKDSPRPGWVPGDQAVSPETRAEVAEMRAKVADIEKELAQASKKADGERINEDFAHGQDEVELPVERSDEDTLAEGAFVSSARLKAAWDDIIVTVGCALLGMGFVPEMRLAVALDGAVSKWASERWRWSGANLESHGFVIVRTQLRALGIIEMDVEQGERTGTRFWRLTSAGDRYLQGALAIRRE